MSNQEQKFNIGDNVIIFDTKYFTNPFHFKEFIKSGKVTDANDMHFSIRNSPQYSWDSHWQNTGKSRDNHQQVFHAKKDSDKIKEIIKNSISEYDLFTHQKDYDKISELKMIIKECKKEIDEINKGNGKWKLGFTYYNNKEYKNKVLEFIKSVFNYEN